MIFVINIKICPALVSLDASFIIGYAELTTLNCCCKLEWFGSVFDIQTSLPPAPCRSKAKTLTDHHERQGSLLNHLEVLQGGKASSCQDADCEIIIHAEGKEL